MQVELVNIQTSDGVRLDGYLRTSEAFNSLGLDLMICHHGVGANFYGPSFFDAMGDALLERGCSFLRVNSRGHDQAFFSGDRRLGAAYEVIDDCRSDFKSWLDFAEQRGFRSIGLWGHSLGAVKTVYWLSAYDDPRVICAVASSPPRFAYALYRDSADGARFVADITRAQELVSAGKPDEILEARLPVPRPFSARTYLDKYGPDARYDYFAHLPHVRKPLLLTLGSQEAENISFAPLADAGSGFGERWPGVAFESIDGADHSYADRTAALWSTVSTWLEGAVRLSPVRQHLAQHA